MEKLGELKECMKKLVERTNNLNESHNKDINSFINLQSNYDTFEEFFENEDVGDWTVKDIEIWESFVEEQTIISKAFTICANELYLGDFLRLDNSEFIFNSGIITHRKR